jgi:3-oxoadipate enol-lactonase
VTVELNYRLDGPAGAPALVLGNSLGTRLAMWDLVAELLSADFRIVRYDHRGQGGSPVPDGPYGIADLGRDVVALLDALSIPVAAYAGVSIGGMVGLWLAADAPERIHKLAVFCSSAHPGTPEAWRLRAETVRAAGSIAPVAEAVVSRWLTPEFADRHPETLAGLLEMLNASPVAGYAELCDMLAELDLRADLGRIRTPALVVAGAQDTALPPPHSELIANNIGGSRYELLEPSAHIPMAERPETVAALIREHLNDQ